MVSARLAYAGYDGEDLAAGVRQLILDLTVKNSSEEPFTLVSRSLGFTFDGKKLKANLVDGASDVDPGSISERQVVTVDIPAYHAGDIDLTVYGVDADGGEVERSVALSLPPD